MMFPKNNKNTKIFITRIVWNKTPKPKFSEYTSQSWFCQFKKAENIITTNGQPVHIDLPENKIWRKLKDFEQDYVNGKTKEYSESEQKRIAGLLDKAFTILKEQMVRRN